MQVGNWQKLQKKSLVLLIPQILKGYLVMFVKTSSLANEVLMLTLYLAKLHSKLLHDTSFFNVVLSISWA